MQDNRTTIPDLDQVLPGHTRAAWCAHFDAEWACGRARGTNPEFAAEVSTRLTQWRRAIESEWLEAPLTA